MKVLDLEMVRGGARNVTSRTWESARMLNRSDGMGFSFHITTMYAGTETRMCYRHHLEAVYCIAGEGSVECVADGVRHAVRPGVLYALDAHDEHVLRAESTLVLACVFTPPLVGDEVHDETGAYPATAPQVQVRPWV